jgi:hypothetical protein
LLCWVNRYRVGLQLLTLLCCSSSLGNIWLLLLLLLDDSRGWLRLQLLSAYFCYCSCISAAGHLIIPATNTDIAVVTAPAFAAAAFLVFAAAAFLGGTPCIHHLNRCYSSCCRACGKLWKQRQHSAVLLLQHCQHTAGWQLPGVSCLLRDRLLLLLLLVTAASAGVICAV